MGSKISLITIRFWNSHNITGKEVPSLKIKAQWDGGGDGDGDGDGDGSLCNIV